MTVRFNEASVIVSGQARKAYRVTDLGQKTLSAKVTRMQDLIAAVQDKLA